MAERQPTALETSILVYVAQNGPLTQAALEKLQTFEFNLRKKAEPNQDSLALRLHRCLP